jgi:hypothetical protein
MPLEKLDGALMPLGGGAARERAQIPSLAATRILLSRVQPVFPGWQFSNHG